MQHLRSVSGAWAHVKWAELLDKLTIAGHSHQTAAELYAEISDHMPLLKDVSYHLHWLLYIPTVCITASNTVAVLLPIKR